MSEINYPLIRHLRGDQYEIESPSGKTYFMDAAKATCTCPSFEFRCRETPGKPCKHLEWLAGLLEVQRACPVCEGKGWLFPTFGHADVPGAPPCRDPLACGTCDGTGTRATADPYMLRLHDERVAREEREAREAAFAAEDALLRALFS